MRTNIVIGCSKNIHCFVVNFVQKKIKKRKKWEKEEKRGKNEESGKENRLKWI